MKTSKLTFRLQRLLIKRKERVGNWFALERAIRDASGGVTVDRRKLKMLCEDDEKYERVPLSIAELKALDQYLLQFNQGLAEIPIFEREENFLDDIYESSKINFYVASKYHNALNTEAISRWDMRAITRLMRTKLNEIDTNIWDVGSIEDSRRLLEMGQGSNEARIAIGSPLACKVSELLMAQMIGIAPFEPCPIEQLPFYIFGIDQPDEFHSPFIRDPEEVKLTPKGAGRQGLCNGGIQIIGQAPCSNIEDGNDLALLLAQRDKQERQIHAVLCGLSGPATYGLSKSMQDDLITRTLPELNKIKPGDKFPPILAAVVLVKIEGQTYPRSKTQDLTRKQKRELRRVTDFEVIHPIFVLHHVNGSWET